MDNRRSIRLISQTNISLNADSVPGVDVIAQNSLLTWRSTQLTHLTFLEILSRI